MTLEAALKSLGDMSLSALQFPDQVLPALQQDGMPAGSPDGFLWVRAHAIKAEVGREGGFYRRSVPGALTAGVLLRELVHALM